MRLKQTTFMEGHPCVIRAFTKWSAILTATLSSFFVAAILNAQVSESLPLRIEKIQFSSEALNWLGDNQILYSEADGEHLASIGPLCDLLRARLEPDYIRDNGRDVSRAELLIFQNLSETETMRLSLVFDDDLNSNLVLPPKREIGVCINVWGRFDAPRLIGNTVRSATARLNDVEQEFVLSELTLESRNLSGSVNDSPLGFEVVKPTEQGYSAVRVFYGTGRTNEGSVKEPVYLAGHSAELSVGEVVVTIPNKRKLGEIPRPWKANFLGISFSRQEDPKEHFTLQHIRVQSVEEFSAELKDVISANGSRSLMVFVHGYNVTFEQAAFRTAQIAHDTNYSGVPLFYSWPSNGTTKDYGGDDDAVLQTRENLIEFLKHVRIIADGRPVNIIVHSLGSKAVLDALNFISSTKKIDASIFGQIIFAAPDVATTVFESIVPNLEGVSEGLTLYASHKDKALIASSILHSLNTRAGFVPKDGPVTIPGLDSIDASSIDLGFLNIEHSQYAESRELLNDIGLLIEHNLTPPNARNVTLLKFPSPKTNLPFWVWPN